MALINNELYATYTHGYIRKHSLSNGNVIDEHQFTGYPYDVHIYDHLIYDGNSSIYVSVRESNSAGELYKLDLSLNQVWNYSFPFSSGNQQPIRIALGLDGTIIAGVGNKHLYSIKPDGTQYWMKYISSDVESAYTPVIAGDGTIYISSGSGVIALNPDNSQKWSTSWGGSARQIALVPDNISGGCLLYTSDAADE